MAQKQETAFLDQRSARMAVEWGVYQMTITERAGKAGRG